MTVAPILEVKSVTQRFGGLTANADVSLSVARGEILGLTGLMGSGRTRLANCLYGMVRPDSGCIRLTGKEVSFEHPAQALAEGIAMIPEDRNRNASFLHQNVLALHRVKSGHHTDERPRLGHARQTP